MAHVKSFMLCGKTLLSSNIKYQIGRNLSTTLPCGLKSNLPIKWYRPEKIPCVSPIQSGDLEPVISLDVKNTRPLEFQDSEELKTADDTVKKLFTLEYFPRSKTRDVLREKYMAMAKRHELDNNSPEARIARMTANIRNLQAMHEQHPRNKMLKVRLKEKIDKRKRLLLELREQDYKCFEYLLEKLNLEYKPYPPKTVYMRVERKRSLRMLTEEYCNKIVQTKLDDYKAKLDARKKSFLEEKIKSLRWIMKEEKECGVAPTVSEEDVAAVEKQLKDLCVASNEK